ncbi:MAG: peptide chain release factor N(5)-glutamine methyltransferase [Bacteroidetes bacterium]|nr:peptide chain release factor N(5)-glutamine methyltransferase [Bacteroidota bacterium]
MYIRSELTRIYPETEVYSIINLILEHVTGFARTEIFLNNETKLSKSSVKKITEIVSGLERFTPIQYLLGKTEFFGLRFMVCPDVLIPRQETEELTAWIIQEYSGKSPAVLDIGTGSGCIAVSIAKNLPGAVVTGTDISPEAIAIAKQNAAINNVEVSFCVQDILSHDTRPVFPMYDVIVSNPPYIRESEKKQMHRNVLDHEPGIALFVPDDDPLVFYRAIARYASLTLKKDGKIYAEINEALERETAEVFHLEGLGRIEIKKDINGKERMARCSLL